MEIIHFAVLTCSLICTVSSGDITATSKNVEEAIINTTVVMKWQVTPGQNQVIASLRLYVLPDDIELIGGTGTKSQTVTSQGKLLFEDRLTATFNTTGKNEYIATLERIQYKDNHTYQLQAVFDDKTDFERKNAVIQIKKVVSSPIFCDINLEYHPTVNESEVLTVVQNVCGYPIPKLKWKVGDKDFRTVFNPSVINEATRQYEYTFKTQPITRKDCGKNLTLVTYSRIGSMERNAKIDVKFVPSPVSMVLLSRYNTTCVRVTWDGEDTGKCILNYHLQFSGREIIYNTSNTYFTLCNATDVERVTIWASYNGNVGNKTTSGITTTTPPPTTTTTSKTTSKKTNGTVITNGGDKKSNIGLIIGIVGGILFVIIIIIIVVCVLKHKKKNGTGNHSGYAMRVTGEENNYVTDPTRSNGRQPANPDDPEQAIYSELGPGGGRTGPRPAPEQSDYAEMKVDAMGYPIDGAKASEPPTYAPVIKPREGAKRRTPSPPRSNVDGARAAASTEPPTYAPVIKNRSSSRGRSPPPDEDDHEGVIV
uniref:Allorecognition 1 n=1 Tax=Hydractinia symbiolongicarpus TaxID=13093 RepID=D9ZHS9_HYDSY|nr:allorecognition 1 [Hydractinia symbiolongicarpus]